MLRYKFVSIFVKLLSVGCLKTYFDEKSTPSNYRIRCSKVDADLRSNMLSQGHKYGLCIIRAIWCCPQAFQPMATQLSMKAVLPLAKGLATASYRMRWSYIACHLFAIVIRAITEMFCCNAGDVGKTIWLQGGFVIRCRYCEITETKLGRQCVCRCDST